MEDKRLSVCRLCFLSVDPPSAPTGVACLQYFLAPPGGGRLESVVLPEKPDAVWSAQLKQSGTELPIDPVEGGWVGGYIVRAASEIAALALSRRLRQAVRVNGRANVVF
jgi:hypothetical protein